MQQSLVYINWLKNQLLILVEHFHISSSKITGSGERIVSISNAIGKSVGEVGVWAVVCVAVITNIDVMARTKCWPIAPIVINAISWAGDWEFGGSNSLWIGQCEDKGISAIPIIPITGPRNRSVTTKQMASGRSDDGYRWTLIVATWMEVICSKTITSCL